MYEFMFNKYSSEAASLGRKTREQNGIEYGMIVWYYPWYYSLISGKTIKSRALTVGASKPYFLHFELNNKWLKSFLWVFSAPPSWRESVGVLVWCDVFRPGHGGNSITMINARVNSYNNDTSGRRRINQTFVIIFWHKYINYFLFVLPYFFFSDSYIVVSERNKYFTHSSFLGKLLQQQIDIL